LTRRQAHRLTFVQSRLEMRQNVGIARVPFQQAVGVVERWVGGAPFQPDEGGGRGISGGVLCEWVWGGGGGMGRA